MDEKWKMFNYTFVCIHGEKLREKELKKDARKRTSKKSECPFRIHTCFNTEHEVFMVTSSKLKHNHEISEEIFELIYPQNRKLDHDDRERLKGDLKLQANPRLVLEKYRTETGKKLLLKDVHNIKGELLTKEKDLAKEIDQIAKRFAAEENGNTIQILVDESKELNGVFIQSAYGKKLFNQNSSCFQMDGTYCTNLSKYSLYLILNQDKTCVGRIIAAYLTRNEDSLSIGNFLELFKQQNDTSKLQTVVIDKDPCKIKALEENFTNIKIIYCYFHNINNIDAALRSDPPLKRFQILNLFKAMSKTTSIEDFNEYAKKIKEIASEKFYTYFSNFWLNCKERWAGFSDAIKNTNGVNTNARIEAKNKALKQVLSKSDKLDTFLKKYLAFLKQDEFESKYKFWNQKLSSTRNSEESQLLEYIRLNYATNMFEKCAAEQQLSDFQIQKNSDTIEFSRESQKEATFDITVFKNLMYFKLFIIETRMFLHVFQELQHAL